MYKTHHSRTTFGSWDVEKVHAVVVRRTFRSLERRLYQIILYVGRFSICTWKFLGPRWAWKIVNFQICQKNLLQQVLCHILPCPAHPLRLIDSIWLQVYRDLFFLTYIPDVTGSFSSNLMLIYAHPYIYILQYIALFWYKYDVWIILNIYIYMINK